MDRNKDEMKPNKRWCLWKKGNRVGSKGNRLKNKSGWGGAGGRAQRLLPQCVPRKKHRGTSRWKDMTGGTETDFFGHRWTWDTATDTFLETNTQAVCRETPVQKNYHATCTNHHENASHPNGFKLWKTTNKMTCFNIKTPCKRMIHVCLGQIFLLQNASNSNVQSITSTSKKSHLLV